MPLGLIGGLVGAAAETAVGVVGAAAETAAGVVGLAAGTAAGVVGAAVGTVAEVAGAALHVGSQVLETAANIADIVVVELAKFAVNERCKIVGSTLRLKDIVDAKITVGPERKIYRLVLNVEDINNGSSIVKTHEAVVHCPWLDFPSLSIFN